MNRYHIVTEYIEYYMFKRRLTRAEFCKICEISPDEFLKIENNQEYDLNVLEKISKYINVPMNLLYIDLDDDHFKPILDDFQREMQSKNKTTNLFFI